MGLDKIVKFPQGAGSFTILVLSFTYDLPEFEKEMEERLRTHLRRRYKLICRAQAYGRFLSHKLYGRYGFFKIPSLAGWKSTHALR